MGVTGIASNVWDDTPEQTGYQPPPANVGYVAEITGIKEGVDKNNNEYIIVLISLGHDDVEGELKHSEFFSLTEDRLGFLKAFLTGIGRTDLMHEDADWEDLVETQYECDITQRTYKGEIKANTNFKTLVPLAAPEPEPGVAEKPKGKRTGPRRSPRAAAKR